MLKGEVGVKVVASEGVLVGELVLLEKGLADGSTRIGTLVGIKDELVGDTRVGVREGNGFNGGNPFDPGLFAGFNAGLPRTGAKGLRVVGLGVTPLAPGFSFEKNTGLLTNGGRPGGLVVGRCVDPVEAGFDPEGEVGVPIIGEVGTRVDPMVLGFFTGEEVIVVGMDVFDIGLTEAFIAVGEEVIITTEVSS
jgi:hypothetical protein